MEPSTFETSSSGMTIPPEPKLTVEQRSKYSTFLSRVSEWNDAFHGDSLREHERRFLTRECLLRYLRASKWVVADSLRRLDATLMWRRQHHVDEFNAEYWDTETRTGKLIVLGCDIHGRSCLYYDVSKDTPELTERQLWFLSFMTERIIDMMQPGMEGVTVISDLTGVFRADMPSTAKTRAYITAFQDHNPERLGLALVTGLPWWFHGLWKIIRLFMDPVVRDKVKFDEDTTSYVAKECLWEKYGGELNFEVENETYWTKFLDEAEKRRDEYVRRWCAAGKRLGESETYLRGGDEVTRDELIAKE